MLPLPLPPIFVPNTVASMVVMLWLADWLAAEAEIDTALNKGEGTTHHN